MAELGMGKITEKQILVKAMNDRRLWRMIAHLEGTWHMNDVVGNVLGRLIIFF